jgi:hypothetical protein
MLRPSPFPRNFIDGVLIQINSNTPQDDAPLREIRRAIDEGLATIMRELPSGYQLLLADPDTWR